MKCIRSLETQQISRVPNTVAEGRVLGGQAEYVSKKIWKTEVRDGIPITTDEVPILIVPEKGEKTREPQKRRRRRDRRLSNPGGKKRSPDQHHR